jgi:hypothetical protein
MQEQEQEQEQEQNKNIIIYSEYGLNCTIASIKVVIR